MMGSLTWQEWIAMLITHAGPPCVAIYVAYARLKARHEETAQKIIVQINGGIEERVREGIAEGLAKIAKEGQR